VTLPSAAVERGPQGLFTYVVKADSTVEMRPITVAEDTDGVAVIGEGVQPGERVVISNQYRLEPGARVRTLSAAIAPSAAPAPVQSGQVQSGQVQSGQVQSGQGPTGSSAGAAAGEATPSQVAKRLAH